MRLITLGVEFHTVTPRSRIEAAGMRRSLDEVKGKRQAPDVRAP